MFFERGDSPYFFTAKVFIIRYCFSLTCPFLCKIQVLWIYAAMLPIDLADIAICIYCPTGSYHTYHQYFVTEQFAETFLLFFVITGDTCIGYLFP